MNRRRTIQLLRGCLLAIVLVVLAVELAAELGALTPWVADKLQSELAEHGLGVRVERARVGIFAGIRLRDVTLRDAGDKGLRLAHAARIRGSVDYGALLRGSLRLRSVSVADVSIFAPPDPSTPALRPIARIAHATARVYSDRLRIESMRGTFRQLPVSAAGTVRALDAMTAKTAATPRHKLPANWSWAGTDLPRIGDAPPMIRRILADMRDNTFSEEDSGLDIAFDLPLDNPGKFKAAGTLSLTHFFLLNTPVRTLKGTVKITPSAVKIPTWTAFLDDGTSGRGSLYFDRRERQISGQLRSSLSVTRLQTSMSAMPALAENVNCPAPASVRISIDPSPPKLESLTGSLRISAPQLTCRETSLGALEINGTYEKGTVDLPTVSLSPPGAQPDTLTGNLTLDTKNKTLSANLSGAIAAPRLHDLLGPLLPKSSLAAIGRSGRLGYQLKLDKSPLEWTKWTGTAELETTEIELAGVAGGTVRIPLEFSETELRGNDLSAEFANGSSATGSFSLTRPALLLNAELQTTTSSAFLTSLLPEPAASGKLANLDVDAMDITLKAENVSLKTPNWALSGTLSTDAGTFENFAFDSISDTSFELTRTVAPQKRFELHCRVPTVDMGPHSHLRDAEITVRAGAADGITVHMSGRAQATPDFVRAFIFGPRFQRRYDRIWNDFHWNEEAPPRTHLKSLHFHDNLDKENRHWFLRLEADTAIPECRYRQIRARNLAGTILIDLPAQVRFKDLTATAPDTPDNGDIEGDITFHLKNNPRCRFSIKGSMEANRILASFIPDWPKPSSDSQPESEPPPIVFTPPTTGSFTGTIPFGDPNALTLSGTVDKAAKIAVAPIPFRNASGQWRWADKCLTIKRFSADLHDGHFSGNGQYCFVTRDGTLAFAAADVQLQPLLAEFAETGQDQQEGRLDITDADIEIRHTGDDNNLELDGAAKLELEESDLWKIPLFSKLASMLNVSFVRKIIGLGDITALAADLEFKDGTVLIRDFTTDGTVMSLEGIKPGSYNWRTQELNLVVRGKILKKTIIVPFLTSPISWLFEAELRGTRTQPEWRLLNAVKEGIFGSGDN